MEENDELLPEIQERCASCGAKLKGDYCRKCGEKKIVPERDLSVSKFMTQMFGHVVHFDSKLIKTCILLFTQPGALTEAWITGRRVRYMKPLQLFVISGIAFYFFLPNVSAYFSTIEDLNQGFNAADPLLNLFHFDFGAALGAKASALQTDPALLEKEIVKEAARQSKTWLFLIIPCWGACIYLVYRGRSKWLVQSLVFAMHGFTFYILADLTIHFVLFLLQIPQMGKFVLNTLRLVMYPYLVFATHKVYGGSWLESVLKSILILLALMFFLLAYKHLITIVMFWMHF